MKISLVTHCYAMQKHLYAALLRAQLSSIALNKPKSEVIVHVVISKEDMITRHIAESFLHTLDLKIHALENKWLWRRAVGRNYVAKQDHDSDLIWFTDCDYLFTRDCLDVILQEWELHEKPDMIWPKSCLAHMDKSPVDRWCEVSAYTGGVGLPPVSVEELGEHRFGRPIGGLHCVSGMYAREFGYLHGTKWMKPVQTPFPDFRDDVAFRKQVQANGRVVAIKALSGLIRLRHTETGYGKNQTSENLVQNSLGL